jgi:hypothetical protein
VRPSRPSRMVLATADGSVIGDGVDDVALVNEERPVVLRLTNEGSYDLRNVSGTVSVTATFGTAADGLPPSFTSLRLVDPEGKPTDRWPLGARATFVASAIDRRADADDRVRDESIAVSYRPHGTAAWMPVAVSILQHDYETGSGRTPRGTLFGGALVPLAAGFYDLRMTVEDLAGNRNETVLAPAFEVVGRSGRSRAVRH